MANIHSQEKRILRAERERFENRRYTSAIKTYFRRLQTAVGEGDDDAANAEHRQLTALIDKAVKRGALHRNTGARKKSRAARLRTAGADEAAGPRPRPARTDKAVKRGPRHPTAGARKKPRPARLRPAGADEAAPAKTAPAKAKASRGRASGANSGTAKSGTAKASAGKAKASSKAEKADTGDKPDTADTAAEEPPASAGRAPRP